MIAWFCTRNVARIMMVVFPLLLVCGAFKLVVPVVILGTIEAIVGCLWIVYLYTRYEGESK